MRKRDLVIVSVVGILLSAVGSLVILAQEPLGGSDTYAEACRILFNAQRAADPVQREMLLQDAVALYSRVVQDSPEFAGAYLKRGIAYAELGHYERAIVDYNATLRLEPENAEVLRLRGIAFEVLGNKLGALEDYNAFLRMTEDVQRGPVVQQREDITQKVKQLTGQLQVAAVN